MNSNNNMIELQMELPIEHEKKVFGQFDEHIKILERSLAVTLISRDGVLKIVGPASNAARAKECLTQLLELSRRGNDINTQNVNYAISLVMEDSGSSLAEIDSDCICHTVAGRPGQTENTRSESVRGCDPGKDDRLRRRPCRNRKNVPCDGDGDHGIPKR